MLEGSQLPLYYYNSKNNNEVLTRLFQSLVPYTNIRLKYLKYTQ